MLKASYLRYILDFTFTAITSRQAMSQKETYFLVISDTSRPGIVGVGECAIFRGLGADDTPAYESKLKHYCQNINSLDLEQIEESSIKFGFETALKDLNNRGIRTIFESNWQQGNSAIPINGLIWMGDYKTMLSRLLEKIGNGYRCIKIKIGGIDFENELNLLSALREMAPASDIEIRLDANGSMSPHNALYRLEKLARYDIHSIEQPIMPGKWDAMHEITRNSPIPIVLDEELIGNMGYDWRCRLLDKIMPQYIILKPSLHGGFTTCDGWITDATEREIGWWATSALESNIGLNAIAQWVNTKDTSIPQGLGTGMLYSNNIPSPLEINQAALTYNPSGHWDLTNIFINLKA